MAPPGAQVFPAQRVPTTAVADNSGTAVFNWRQISCPMGFVLRGVVAVTNAPPAAISNVQFPGLPLPQFFGTNPWGPFDVIGGETLQVVTTGLTAGTTYTAVFMFQQLPQDVAGAGLPIPYSSTSVNAQGIAGGIALSTSDHVDELLDTAQGVTVTYSSVNAAVTVATLTALSEISCLEIQPAWSTSVSFRRVNTIFATNISRGNYGSLELTAATDLTASIWLPITAKPGDQIKLQTRNIIGTLPSTTNAWSVWGHSAPFVPPGPFRPDGRHRPIGMFQAAAQVNATTTLVAAPGLLNRILLKYFSLAILTTGANGLSVSLNGAGFNLARLDNAGMTNVLEFTPDGLLLDANTAITQVVIAGSQEATVIYDVVV